MQRGSTYYGIGSALTRIVEVILRDQRALLTVCTPVDDIAGSLSDGIVASPCGWLDTILLPLSLDNAEEKALRASAQVIKEAYESVKKA